MDDPDTHIATDVQGIIKYRYTDTIILTNITEWHHACKRYIVATYNQDRYPPQ